MQLTMLNGASIRRGKPSMKTGPPLTFNEQFWPLRGNVIVLAYFHSKPANTEMLRWPVNLGVHKLRREPFAWAASEEMIVQ